MYIYYIWVAKIQYTEKFDSLLYSQTHPQYCRRNMVAQVMKWFINGCISYPSESVWDSHVGYCVCVLFSLLSLSSACIATSKSQLQVQVISVFFFCLPNASFSAHSLFVMQKLTCVVLNTHTHNTYLRSLHFFSSQINLLIFLYHTCMLFLYCLIL